MAAGFFSGNSPEPFFSFASVFYLLREQEGIAQAAVDVLIERWERVSVVRRREAPIARSEQSEIHNSRNPNHRK